MYMVLWFLSLANTGYPGRGVIGRLRNERSRTGQHNGETSGRGNDDDARTMI